MSDIDKPAIVVGVDGSAGSQEAVRWACAEAALRGRAVTAVLSWAPDGLPRAVFRAASNADHTGLMTAAAQVLDGALARVPTLDPPVEVRPVVAEEDAVSALLRAGERAPMIVVGARGAGLGHRLPAGSVCMRVVHHARTPVAVVRGTGGFDPADRRPVVVGVDASPQSVSALSWAAREASLRKVPLRAVYAWHIASPPYSTLLEASNPNIHRHAQDVLDRALEMALVNDTDVEVAKVVVAESAARVLVGESEGAQLLVVGSRGHGGFAELLLGSVSHQCVTHSACPVVVIH
jgi:nucleotide-binding universal stress UspA family protein